MVEWFEDLKIGMRFKSEAVTVSKDDIVRFAREYDPQPFHLDEEAAKSSILGGLAASGWHTAAIAMRLAASCKPFGPHPLFGAGVDDLRWLKPVRPGDSIHLEGELVELVPSRSKPHGVARVKWTAYNQDGEAVYTFNPIAIVPQARMAQVPHPVVCLRIPVARDIWVVSGLLFSHSRWSWWMLSAICSAFMAPCPVVKAAWL